MPAPPAAGRSTQAPRHSAAAPAAGTASDTGQAADIADLERNISRTFFRKHDFK